MSDVGTSVGAPVGMSDVGIAVGAPVGMSDVGTSVGAPVGMSDVGIAVGAPVGMSDVGIAVGASVSVEQSTPLNVPKRQNRKHGFVYALPVAGSHTTLAVVVHSGHATSIERERRVRRIQL
jgi:hypothetical protein